ncbi:TPA: hypothetical protein ACMD15_003401 [Vibrio cholerae]
MLLIEPHQLAFELLKYLGIDFGIVYNHQGGIRREQLRLLSRINKKTGAKTNIYKTIHRLESSKNPENIQWTKNIQNVLVGTVQASIMDRFSSIPIEDQKKIKIKWVPSAAKRPDATHAKNYGKVMTLSTAIKRGLGLRYGCQCGFIVVGGQEIAKDVLKKFRTEVFKQ